jgi:hypothetical protein
MELILLAVIVVVGRMVFHSYREEQRYNSEIDSRVFEDD